MRQTSLFAFVFLFGSMPAFADKILGPGEFYTSESAGERIVCTVNTPSQPDTQSFFAEGRTIMTESEARDSSACTGVMDSSTAAMFRAKNIAQSNGHGIQCPQGYRCEVQEGAMQYRRRGDYCIALMPFTATRR